MFGGQTLQTASAQSGALPAAVGWIEGMLLGSVGATIAVLTIAGVGFAMLQGRLSPRKAAQAVFGCFILFGAPAVAKGLADIARGTSQPVVLSPQEPVPSFTPPPAPPPSNPDPYAGASVPM